jgi:hypothetical protein
LAAASMNHFISAICCGCDSVLGWNRVDPLRRPCSSAQALPGDTAASGGGQQRSV